MSESRQKAQLALDLLEEESMDVSEVDHNVSDKEKILIGNGSTTCEHEKTSNSISEVTTTPETTRNIGSEMESVSEISSNPPTVSLMSEPVITISSDSASASKTPKEISVCLPLSTQASFDYAELPSTSILADEVFTDIQEKVIVTTFEKPRVVPEKPKDFNIKPKICKQRRIEPGFLQVDINIPEDPLSPYPKPPKSPITVQEWVNSIDLEENERQEEPVPVPSQEQVSHDSGYQSHLDNPVQEILEDNLNLGAEARNINGLRCSAVSGPQKRKSSLSPGRASLADFRNKQSSFNSEASTLSTVSSLSSVESLLEARREDPEEILLALGFGGSPALDPLSRIPQRFLCQPSSARGVDVDSFLKQQEEDFQKQECSCLGYRGLTAISPGDNKQPSAIATKIIERLGESNIGQRTPSLPGGINPCPQNFVSTIIAATAFKTPKSRRRSESILDPANRDFLLKQGQEEKARKSKKLVLGMHTYNVTQEGDLIQPNLDSSGRGPFNLSHPLSPKNKLWKQAFMQMDNFSCVKEAEEMRDLFDAHSSIETGNYPSSKYDDETSSPDSSIASGLYKRKQLIRQMRFEEEESREIAEINLCSECQKPERGNKIHQDQPNLLLKIKDSFELEELSFEEDVQLPAGNQSSVLVEVGSISESSGFAEEGHAASNMETSANADSSCAIFDNIPPVEVTFWPHWENEITIPVPNYRGRLSEPNISCFEQQNPELRIEDLDMLPARKGSFPQTSPKRWSPTQCNFLWPSFKLNASSPLSSSETTLTNEMGTDAGQSESDGTLQPAQFPDSRCHSPYFKPVESSASNHRDQSQSSIFPKEQFGNSSLRNPDAALCRRSSSMTMQEHNPHPRRCQRSKSFPQPNELYSVFAQQKAFLEIESLKLALDQYKAQGQRLESCSRRFLNYYPLLTEEQRKSLEYVQHLKLELYREIGHMESLLNQHSRSLQGNHPPVEETSPRLQSALHQMKELLQEQSDLQSELEKFSLSDQAMVESTTNFVPPKDVVLMDAVGEELMLYRRQLKADQEKTKSELQEMLTKTKEEILETVRDWMKSSKETKGKHDS